MYLKNTVTAISHTGIVMNSENIKQIVVLKRLRMFLRLTFLFPSEKEISELDITTYYNYKFTILCCFTLYHSVGIIIHMAINIKNGTYLNVDKDLLGLLSYHGTLYFVSGFVGNLKYILVAYKQFSDFETFGKPTDFDKKNILLDNLASYYCVYHSTVMFLMCINNLVHIRNCKELNILNDTNEVCGLIASTWLPFKYDTFPMLAIVLIYQFFVMFMLFNNAGIISYQIMASIEHVVIRLNHVAECFTKVIKETDPIKRRIMFKQAVRYHIAVVELAALVSKSFSPCMMVHISLTGPVLGCSGYSMITMHAIDSMSLFFSWILSTTLVCTAGQRLADASESIGVIIYNTEWYKIETSLQRDCNFIAMRCSKPIFLKAGPFGYMTYAMLMLIAKTSYSYLTVLMQAM